MRTSLFKLNSYKESDFKKVFEDLYPKLCVFANKYINDFCASEDLVQDVFSDFWRNRKHMNVRSSLKSLLYVTVKNRCINYLKKQVREQEQMKDLKLQETESLLTHNILEQETHAKIYQAIESLPKKTREILLLSMHDASNKEIQEELKLQIDTVKYHKKKAYRMLREIFNK